MRLACIPTTMVLSGLLLGSLWLSTPSHAETRTIQPGDNVQSAMNALRPGDTLLLQKGTYNVGALRCPSSGTSSARVTIAGDPQDGQRKAVLKVGNSGNGVTLTDCRYITFDNLVFDAKGAGAAGVKITDQAHHIRISNSEVRDAGTQGILANAGQLGTEGHNEFVNLHVHGNGQSTRFDHGLYIASSDNRIEGCDIHNNANFGVHVYIEGGDASRNVVQRNRIYDNGTGMVIGAGDNNRASNNLVVNNGAGIQVRNGGSGNQVLNNTIVRNRGGDSGGSCILNVNGGTILQNNLCWQNQTNSINGGGEAREANNRFAAPQFVDLDAGDFHLQAGSPAIKAGADLSDLFRDDLEGKTRALGKFDLGALAVGGQSGPTPGALPAPRNLRLMPGP